MLPSVNYHHQRKPEADVYNLISSPPVCMNRPNGIFYCKVEKQCRLSICLFQTILIRKHVRRIFADSVIGFV